MKNRASALRVVAELHRVALLAEAGDETSGRIFQAQVELEKLVLDVLDRLRAEVADVEEVGLRALNEFTNGADAFTLQAVLRAGGKVENRDGPLQVRGLGFDDGRGAQLDSFDLVVELDAQPE